MPPAPCQTCCAWARTGSSAGAGRPLEPGWRARLGCRSVLSLRLEGEDITGRLLVLDKPGLSADDLVLGAVVARQVTGELD